MNTQESFAIKTDVFEGPLDLLLDLIEKRKLLINDISLAAVTDEYMAYVAELQQGSDDYHMHETSQFVLVASTLLLIKSKSLLPVLELTDEEEGSIEDLEYRLKLYQVYKKAGGHILNHFGTHALYGKCFIPDDTPLFITDTYTNTDALHNAMRDVLTTLPKKVEKKAVSVRQVVSLEDMIGKLKERITKQLRISFIDFSKDSSERSTVIVSFLAVLELVKQGEVMVRQEKRFSDFDIEREGVDTPKYS